MHKTCPKVFWTFCQMLKNYQTLAKTLNIWPKCRRNFGNFDRSHCLSDSFGGTAQKSNLNVQCGGWLDLTLTSVTRFGKISLLWQIFSGLWHIFDSLFLIWLDIASHMTSCNQLVLNLPYLNLLVTTTQSNANWLTTKISFIVGQWLWPSW